MEGKVEDKKEAEKYTFRIHQILTHKALGFLSDLELPAGREATLVSLV